MASARVTDETERPSASDIAEALLRGDTVTIEQRHIAIDGDMVWGNDECGLSVLISVCACDVVGKRCIERGIRWLLAKKPSVGLAEY